LQESIQIHDITALTKRAGLRLLTFLSNHRSIWKSIVWNGAPQDFLVHLLPEQRNCKILTSVDWTIRIIDAISALSYRGYPKELRTELHFEVIDNLLPWNNSRFIFSISDGKPNIGKGGKGKFRIDIRGLSALYTGHLTPYELRVLGYIEAEDDDIQISQLIFGENRPWMSDYF